LNSDENSSLNTILIERRFCGPPESGHGGYVAGYLAENIDGPARVRLLKPPPLEAPMEIVKTDEGVDLLYQGEVVARAWPGDFEADAPAAPSLEEARAMSRNFGGFHGHAFPTCFGCGPDRQEGNGMRIFAGSASDSNLVAAPWKPDRSLGDKDGQVFPRFIWSALDCAGAWSFMPSTGTPTLLGEFSVRIDGPVHTAGEYIVVGWEIKRDGRKHLTGTAIYSVEGELLAVSRATWFDIDLEYLR
jgi:hypothetical protein